MIRRLCLCTIIIGTMIIGGAVNAFAGAGLLGELEGSDGISLGAMKIHLGAKLGERFDSNVYSTPKDLKDDFITVLSPAILATLKTQRNKLSLGISPDINSYNEYDDESFTATTAKASYALKSLGGFSLRLSDNYVVTTDPRPEQNVPIRTKNTTNTFSIGVDYKFPANRFTLKTFYEQMDLDYEKDENSAQERRNKDVRLGIYYKLLPKTSVVLEYVLVDSEYFSGKTTDADSKNHTTNLGLEWAPSAKLNGAFKIGFQRRQYDNTKYADADDEMMALDANLSYKITEVTAIDLLLNRSMNETSYAGNATLGIAEAAHYKATKFGFGMKSVFMDKIRLGFKYTMEAHTYNRVVAAGSNREDKLQKFEITSSYMFAKRFSAGLDYSYKNLDADDPNNDEVHTLITLNMKFLI